MKHSTFYTRKGARLVYTTKALTPHHKFLRDTFYGTTYKHPDDDKLYFVPGVPLDRPLRGICIARREP